MWGRSTFLWQEVQPSDLAASPRHAAVSLSAPVTRSRSLLFFIQPPLSSRAKTSITPLTQRAGTSAHAATSRTSTPAAAASERGLE